MLLGHRRAFLRLNAQLSGQIGRSPVPLLADLASALLYLQGAVIVWMIKNGGMVGLGRLLLVHEWRFTHSLAR